MRCGLLVCLMAGVLPCAMPAQTVLPSPAELIAKAIAAKKAQIERGWKYTYREDHEQSQLDKNGKAGPPSTKTWEHIMLEGSEYKKLILVDGKPLDAKTQRKVDEELEKARSERRKNGLLSLHRTVSLGGLDLMERLFDNKVTGEETIAGRRTWRMESEPKAGYKPAGKLEEEALASRRVIWFDQEDGYQMKEDSLFIRTANGFQPGSTIDLEFTKVGDDWLLASATMRAELKMMPLVGGRVRSQQRFYDYKRFMVDSTLTPE